MYNLPLIAREETLIALALIALIGLGWSVLPSTPPLQNFEYPRMAIAERAGVNICMTRPGQPYLPRAQTTTNLVVLNSCPALSPPMLRVFEPNMGLADANRDFDRGALRLVGRVDPRGLHVVIPGLNCASDNLRQVIYDFACLIVVRPECPGVETFDAYAEAYNVGFLSRSVQSNPECRVPG